MLVALHFIDIRCSVINPLNTELSPSSPNYSAGFLNFASAFQKTRIFQEPSRINLWDKKHFVGKETDIDQNTLKML